MYSLHPRVTSIYCITGPQSCEHVYTQRWNKKSSSKSGTTSNIQQQQQQQQTSSPFGVAFLFLRILYDRNLDPLDLRDPQVVLQARSGDHENPSDKKHKETPWKAGVHTNHPGFSIIFWQIRYETCLFVAHNSILVQPFSKHSDPFPYHCMNCEDDRKKKVQLECPQQSAASW